MFIEGKLNRSVPSKLQVYKPGQLLPVLPAANLLASARYQGMLQQLRQLVQLNSEHFEALYEDTIARFAEFVQVLPSQNNNPLWGMLNGGLARATLSLQQFIQTEGKKADPLLAYVIFTAGLLMDVAKVIINQRVILSDEEGNYIDDWRPYEGGMLGRADYYRIYPRSKLLQRIDSAMTIILARQVMPKLGFSWLASDLNIFADWFDALQDEDSGGSVGLSLAKLRREDIFSFADSLAKSQPQVSTIESEATQHAEAFFTWLKNGLANQDIKVNTSDAGVHIVQEGVFLERNKIFKQFVEIFNLPVNMNVVFAQFGNMFGVGKKGGNDFAYEQYFSEYPEASTSGPSGFASPLTNRQRSIREGIVLHDPSIVFVNSQLPPVTTNLKSISRNSEHQLPLLPQQKYKPNYTT